MVRPIGMLVGLGFVAALLWSLVWNVVEFVSEPPQATVEEMFYKKPRQVSWTFSPPFGKYDNQQLQRGFQVYKEVCAACHSLQQVAFRDLEDIGFTKAEVKAIANQWVIEVPTINEETGETTTRKAIPSDKFPRPHANDVAAAAANAGAIPPDLSLIVKARKDGANKLYSLLTGYQPPSAELMKAFPDFEVPAGKHHNPYFHALNISMAQPLVDGSVTYTDGTPTSMRQNARDVTAFLAWAAEPTLPERHGIGLAALLYLIVATGLAYLAYRGIWADKKPKKLKSA
jgi:ubiquinol-cytochrome c reductase cytochrome c1 subunit